MLTRHGFAARPDNFLDSFYQGRDDAKEVQATA